MQRFRSLLAGTFLEGKCAQVCNFVHSTIFQSKGVEPIYFHGPHELYIIAGGPQNQLI